MIIVTGGTGFVGRKILERLGEDAVALDRGAFDLERGELDAARLRGARAIVHTAAFLPPDYRDPAHAERCLKANALGTLALLRAAVTAEVPALIGFGSGNAYRDAGRPAREDDPLFPSAAAPYYLASKVVQEIYTAHFGDRLRTVMLRPSAIYGPGMKPSGVVPLFAGKLRRREPIQIADGGRHSVDLVFVDDVVRAAVAAIDAQVSGAFNVGSGVRTTVLEVASALAELSGAPRELLEVAPARDAPPTGFAPLDIERARTELGLTPTPLREGLAAYLACL